MHHAPEVLKKEGHKLTPQRLLIWHILIEGKHLTANEIHNKVKKKFKGVDLATVYRTLELLVRVGSVQESTFPIGPTRYEATEHVGHNHVICRVCGRVEHFEGDSVDKNIGKICAAKDYDAENTEIKLLSTCKACIERAS